MPRPIPVAQLVTHDRAQHHRQQKPAQRNRARCGKHAGGYQQGIARKEKSDKESGFNEKQLCKQAEVRPARTMSSTS